MVALYNENDPAAAHVLRYMISEGIIAYGHVNEKSIKDLTPDDVKDYCQVHLFAGGGFWSVAARLAGWPDDEPLWTASFPCQPFSAAGKGGGINDPRHLWPDGLRLISAVRPAVIMGEQVEKSTGYGWFDGVRTSLEAENYASRSVDFPACAVNAPHKRNRQYWCAVADDESDIRGGTGLRETGPERDRSVAANGDGASGTRGFELVNTSRVGRCEGVTEPIVRIGRSTVAGSNTSNLLGDSFVKGLEGQRRDGNPIGRPVASGSITAANGGVHADTGSSRSEFMGSEPSRGVDEKGTRKTGEFDRCDGDRTSFELLPDTIGRECNGWSVESQRRQEGRGAAFGDNEGGGNYWSDAEWINCHDDKARRTKPGLRFLVNGLPGRVDLWRIGGNAIVPEAAKEVIGAFIDAYGLPSTWGR